MKKAKDRNVEMTPSFFWPSYSDLMTSLFFIMMLLYIVTLVRLLQNERELKQNLKATQQQLNLYQNAQKSVEALPKEYFKFEPKYKRFELIKNVSFQPGSSDIDPADYDYLTKVGESIVSLINKLKEDKDNHGKIKYLIIIEGQASKDNYFDNYGLSYRRAKSLYDFWVLKNIIFDPEICEIHISGSGIGGVGREKDENLNMRFLIQIIPKIAEGDPAHQKQIDEGIQIVLKEKDPLIAAKRESKANQSLGNKQQIGYKTVKEEDDEVVFDLKTGLAWQKTISNKKMNYTLARQYCNTLSYGNSSGWQLPSISELKTILKGCGSKCAVSEDCLTEGCMLSKCYCTMRNGPGENGFYWEKGVWETASGSNEFWSSSIQTDATDNGWVVNFETGLIDNNMRRKEYYVRCVRR